MLTSYIQAGGTYIPVYYDFLDGKIKDNNRGIYPNEKTPSTNIIRDYLAEVEDRPLPELAKDNAGALCFRSDPLIKFTKDNYWINKVNNKRLYGLRSPSWQEKENAAERI